MPLVAATGNEYTRGNPTEYPAAYDNVIAVGAVNEADRLAQSARKVPRMRSATRSKAYGYGLLDLPAALA